MDQPVAVRADASFSWPRIPVLGTRVTAATFAGAQQSLDALVARQVGAYVSCANAYSVTLALDNPAYRELLNQAAFVTADGMPIVWALHWLGYPAERVHNDDLALACCDRFRTWRHFLVGGRVGQPQEVAGELSRRFPDIAVVGMHPTPQRPVPPEENARILEEIRMARPSIVWVGMGTPAQDEWMNAAAPVTGVPMVGVGSLFDLLSGRTRPAPDWMKRNGLQWLFRLLQEPRRLGYRYVYYNLRFALALSRQLARHTFSG